MVEKKIYISARFNEKDNVNELSKKLSQLGYDIISTWISHKSIKPYEENQELSRDYSIEDINNSAQCDYFILLTSEAGTGMYVELGSAIFSSIVNGKPKIDVVGEHINRSMFYFHPKVKRVENIEDLLIQLGSEYKNKN